MIDWWRLNRVVRLAFRPTAALSNWVGWWPQVTAAALWLLGVLNLVHAKHLHVGIAWSAALFVGGIALLFLVAAYRLHPTMAQERRDYAELFLSQARWRGAILLEDPALDGGLITQWTNPITNLVHHAFGKLEVDRFIAPGVPHAPSPSGKRLGTGNVITYLDRLVDLCNRFPAIPIRNYDLAAWQRMFSLETWTFTFEEDHLRQLIAPEPPTANEEVKQAAAAHGAPSPPG